jgi:hypothetical protein
MWRLRQRQSRRGRGQPFQPETSEQPSNHCQHCGTFRQRKAQATRRTAAATRRTRSTSPHHWPGAHTTMAQPSTEPTMGACTDPRR